MKSPILIIIIITALTSICSAQTMTSLNDYFNEASLRYNVPGEVLKSIGYVESRFYNSDKHDHTSCSGMPESYGLMGLRNDDWFGKSLIRAAELLNIEPSLLTTNPRLNIQGAAAYLSSIASQLKIERSDINSWKPVVELYSGIPQPNVKDFYSFDVMKIMSEGLHFNDIVIEANPEVDMGVFGDEVNPENKLKNIESDDYQPAVWSPSPNFTTGSINQQFSVVHVTQGSFAGSVSWLQNPNAQASTHYIIRSSDGYIIQLVREQNKAWHAVCWNSYMLGVEHEGFVDNQAWFTDAMYLSSAALYRHFSTRYNIPFSRNRIIGHNEWQNSAWVSWLASNYPAINAACNNHTDPGQYWDWSFYIQLVSQDTTKPVITSYSPASSSDSVFSNVTIKIKFSQRMKKSETQAAFSITPQINGIFNWEDNGRTMVFKPASLLSFGAVYSVNVDTNALNYVGQKIGTALNFNFVTKTYSSLSLLSTYPVNQDSDISSTVKVFVSFDTPINQATFTGAIFLKDSSGTPLGLKNILYKDIDNKGYLSFSPQQKLKSNSDYTLLIKGTVQNIFSAQLGEDAVIKFRTEQDNFIAGTILDDLELIKNWKDPNYSGSTVGTDPNGTTFTIVNEETAQGSNSGKISYVFTGSTGVCRTFDSDKPSVGSDGTDRFGMWIYGDLSYNLLEFWFYYNTSTNTIVSIDTLNWTGWKFIEIPVASIGGSGVRLFHSIVIKQTPSGTKSSAIYIDGIQKRPLIPAGSNENQALISEFSLSQNFPNPFNPSTRLDYSVKEGGLVNISVYNLLGDKVAVILNDNKQPGSYSLEFNAEQYNLSSGIYFYTIRSGKYTATRKMLLLK